MDLIDYIPEEDSPDLTDAEIDSAIVSATEIEFGGQLVDRKTCTCGGSRYIREAKQLLRKPYRYGRIKLACMSCDRVEQLTFRMDWLG